MGKYLYWQQAFILISLSTTPRANLQSIQSIWKNYSTMHVNKQRSPSLPNAKAVYLLQGSQSCFQCYPSCLCVHNTVMRTSHGPYVSSAGDVATFKSCKSIATFIFQMFCTVLIIYPSAAYFLVLGHYHLLLVYGEGVCRTLVSSQCKSTMW